MLIHVNSRLGSSSVILFFKHVPCYKMQAGLLLKELKFMKILRLSFSKLIMRKVYPSLFDPVYL